MNHIYTIGIDEAGRGPLAGPVSVGVVCVPSGFDWDQIPGVNDSKKLTEKKREEIFNVADELVREGLIQTAVSMVSAKKIDEVGIVPSVQLAMGRALERVEKGRITPVNWGNSSFQENVLVKLDGGLKAPQEYVHQETIIKGDSKEKVIGLASIMAKVTRDRYMERIAQKKEFVVYDLGTHKGYGTKKHREAIAQNGLSVEHRKTYCRNIKIL